MENNFNYKKLYENLYKIGYQKNVNIGVSYVESICNNYEFNTLLEIGCSQGYALLEFEKYGKKVKGIDISKTAVSYCKSKGLKCKVNSATDIKYRDNSFDAIFSSDVLEHLIEEDTFKALKEIDRVTRKWVFLKVSKYKEGNREWINKLHNNSEYLEIENLHQTLWDYKTWIKNIRETTSLKFVERKNRILVFEKRSDS
jgi:ubiquinone/menaquinone biosynthesis C-methylase UbiE